MVKSLSTNADEKSARIPVSSSPFVGMSNRVPRPSSRLVTVGKKKGACSAALGASLGLFRTCRGFRAISLRYSVGYRTTYPDGIQVEQGLPFRSRHQGQGHHFLRDLIRCGVNVLVFGLSDRGDAFEICSVR